MNDVTRTCNNTQIRNDGGNKALHFCGKHNSLPTVSVPYLIQKRRVEHDGSVGKLIDGKTWNTTTIQKCFVLDKKIIKTAANNTPALSESIICAVQWGMGNNGSKKMTTILSE